MRSCILCGGWSLLFGRSWSRCGPYGLAGPLLAEPDVIDIADLAGDDLVSGLFEGALECHPLGMPLGFVVVAGRRVALVELVLDELELERPHDWSVRPRFELDALVDQHRHDDPAQELDRLAPPPVVFFGFPRLSGVAPLDDERGLHVAGFRVEPHVDDLPLERKLLAVGAGAALA